MIGKTFDEIQIGDTAFFEKTISESDVYLFAGITGDLNPAHVNQAAAEQSRFKNRIAHGILISGLISNVLGMQLPGPGTIYLAQELRFTAPVYLGETVRAVVEVIEKDAEKKRVIFKTQCIKSDGTLVIDGSATVMPPKK